MTLILSIFPGIDLLGRAFEEQGFCVVRGPDLLWGGDVREFHPPAGRFDGIIGGDPCQAHSRLEPFCRLVMGVRHEDFTPEYSRIVEEAQPAWFLRENVPGAPAPSPAGYAVSRLALNALDCGSEQSRERGFWFGVRGGHSVNLWRWLEIEPLRSPVVKRAVLASDGKRGSMLRTRAEIADGKARRPRHSLETACELQGLPPDFLAGHPFTKAGRHHVIGNGVPLPMGRAIARAVAAAIQEYGP